MKRTTRVAALLACALLIASCTSGSEVTEPAPPTATEVVATETPTVVTEPTATPTPEPILVSEDDRIAAAMAAFEADPQPTELIAYDYLEPLVSTNQIRLTVCGWTGETVFDDVYQVAYRVGQTLNDNGEIDVAFESANTTLDTCTNTELIESALQATRDFDNYWRGVIEDPTSFNEAETNATLAPELIALNQATIEGWATQGLAYRNTNLDAGLPETAVEDVLVRAYTESDVDVLELLACRDLPADFGLYQGDLLIDDFRAGSSQGPHSTDQYAMIRREKSWQVIGVSERVWVDCFGFEDGWLAGINDRLGEPVAWDVIG